MSGIAGFINFNNNFIVNKDRYMYILDNMKETLLRRGSDYLEICLKENIGISNSFLELKETENYIIYNIYDNNYIIALDGELYNYDELKRDLIKKGFYFKNNTDSEIILFLYIYYGIDFIKKLNGIFSIVLWDETKKEVYLIRDRAGVKPIFYTFLDNTLIFASEIKAILKYPEVNPIVNREGLCEIFGLGPARTQGNGIFKNIYDIIPGHYIKFSTDGFSQEKYWDLESHIHTDSYDETIEKVRFLVLDSIKKQMKADFPIASLLSGGLDSSIITAVADNISDEKINTFSFDYLDNNKYFKSNSFQPEEDKPWVDKMVELLKTNHTYLECSSEELANYLYKAVDMKDYPGMADVDSSLLYFCGEVRNYNKIVLTGECADEIFGGYPWFHKNENYNFFPWTDMEMRKLLLNEDFLFKLNMNEYVMEKYEHSIKNVPILENENYNDKKRRELAYINIKWFMSVLIERMDRTGMYWGLQARAPYADYRIIEYVFNIPWKMKGKEVKHILRKSCEGILPDKFLYRKKSPYPKIYNPIYEEIISSKLKEIISDRNSPIMQFLNLEMLNKFIDSPKDYGKPWYGQLMAGPQMMAYLLQINYWLKEYTVNIIL